MTAPVLLYDGHCAFCNGVVRYILRHDRRGTLRFASLDSRYARAALVARPALAAGDSVVWIEGDAIAARSAAALHVAAYLGGAWRIAMALWLVPRPIRDAAYDFIARIRHRLRPPGDDYFVPTQAMLDRMMDDR